MPIFEYRCLSCKKGFEELVFGSEPSVVCPDCNSDKVEKQLSSFAASVGSSKSSKTPCGNSSGCSSGFS